MNSRLNPFIYFGDNTRQAMGFYRDVFGGILTLSTFAEFGEPDSPDANKIMHSQLETTKGFTLMASDTPQAMEIKPGTNISIILSGDDAEELHGYWAKLVDEGTVTVPMEKQVWGDEFGACIDKFGISWMVNIGQPQ